MGIKDRKERERDERRDLILSAAQEIIAAEGLDNLSVRKIANKIEYSPAIIYHYFQDKDDIVNQLMQKSYQKIVGALASAITPTNDPEQHLRDIARNYIELALQMSDEYKTIMLSSSPHILEHTSVLFKGASEKRRAVAMLCETLKAVHSDKDDQWIELTAQIMWTAIFGLIVRLLIEIDIDAEQRQNLIEHHIQCVIDRMILEKF